MPNIAAGIGPALQTFLAMRQYMAQEHASREADRAKALAAQTGIAAMPPGAAAPAPAGPQANPLAAIASAFGGAMGGGQQPQPDQGNAPDPATMVTMPGGPSAGPAPARPGESMNIQSIIQGLHSMGAARPMPGAPQAPPPSAPSAMGAPPVAAQGQPAAQPPPPPPTGTGVAQGDHQQFIPGSKEQFYSIMREVAKTAPPGTPPQRIFEAAMQMIPGIKGMEPETKALLVQSAADQRTIAQLQAKLQGFESAEKRQGMRDDTQVETNDARVQGRHEDVGDQIRGRHEDVRTQQSGQNYRTGQVVGEQHRYHDLQHGDHQAAEAGRNSRFTASLAQRAKLENDKLYAKASEGVKTRAHQAAVAAVKKLPKDTDADTVQSTYDTAYGRAVRTGGGAATGGHVGPYATLQDAQAAVASGKLKRSQAIELARANHWGQ